MQSEKKRFFFMSFIHFSDDQYNTAHSDQQSARFDETAANNAPYLSLHRVESGNALFFRGFLLFTDRHNTF